MKVRQLPRTGEHGEFIIGDLRVLLPAVEMVQYEKGQESDLAFRASQVAYRRLKEDFARAIGMHAVRLGLADPGANTFPELDALALAVRDWAQRQREDEEGNAA